MSDDLERLKARINDAGLDAADAMNEALARIEALRADNARLREAVAPLIVIALDNLDGMDAETREECERDIARARAALNTGKETK